MADDYAEIDRLNRDRWNAAHLTGNQGALSGSSPKAVLDYHGLTSKIKPNTIVLDIGVGTGIMAHHLASLRCVVDCLDVADAAAETVRGVCRRFYRSDAITSLPTDEYDVATSQLVIQHMCERNLREQIEHVFRSLRPGGVYSMHWAGATEGPLNNDPGEIPPGRDGSMCRSPEYALTILQDVLGSQRHQFCVLPEKVNWPQFGSYWYWIHLGKPAEERAE